MRLSETITFENARVLQALIANDPQNLRLMEERFDVKLTARDAWIKVEGTDAGIAQARNVFTQLSAVKDKGHHIRKHEFRFALDSVAKGDDLQLQNLFESRIAFSPRKPPIVPKSENQKAYVDAIRKTDLVFGIGPAGTGKTYIAMAMAVEALKQDKVTRIILTRPAVEAGEALGFLPGDLKEKIAPYLRPLYDALYEMLDPEEIERLMDKGVIELAPLAYMRGRTLSHSFVILDEAQNTTTEQMFMFLTRLGPESKCVVTGDPTQCDLSSHRKSGLMEAMQALKDTEGIAFMRFDDRHVIRHDIVQRVIRAYRAHRGDRATSASL
ncbi:phosphate starvation-inducible protein PhoH [Verrucomicrobia bacterium LW23]|nr:phosphate starvation-inducible protein PhoH [Verrucomicrobia bacterium LW23]